MKIGGSMNYFLTQYCFPLEEKICVSKKLDFFLTNPETEEEINEIAEFFKESNEDENGFPPTNADINFENFITIENTIHKFKENFENNYNSVKTFFQKEVDERNIYRLLAKMTIILKFDYSSAKEAYLKDCKEFKEKHILGFVLLDNNNPLISNSKKAINFSFLLSLLFHTEEEGYDGRNFLINKRHSSFCKNFSDFFLWFMVTSQESEVKENNIDSKWRVFPYIKNEIIEKVKLLDEFSIDENNFKILEFISEILKNCKLDITDNKYKITSLVSVIEMLLTHNPDFNRFNVEDSIVKQFKLKLGVLLYLDNNNIDFDSLEKKLKLIYSLRSNIAHGNFNQLNETILKFYEFYKEQIDYIDSKGDVNLYLEYIIGDLYKYIRIILNRLIIDRKFLNFIKKS